MSVPLAILVVAMATNAGHALTEKRSDPVADLCSPLCQEESSLESQCAAARGCYDLDVKTYPDAFETCWTPCWDAAGQCFSLCADSFDDTLQHCFNVCMSSVEEACIASCFDDNFLGLKEDLLNKAINSSFDYNPDTIDVPEFSTVTPPPEYYYYEELTPTMSTPPSEVQQQNMGWEPTLEPEAPPTSKAPPTPELGTVERIVRDLEVKFEDRWPELRSNPKAEELYSFLVNLIRNTYDEGIPNLNKTLRSDKTHSLSLNMSSDNSVYLNYSETSGSPVAQHRGLPPMLPVKMSSDSILDVDNSETFDAEVAQNGGAPPMLPVSDNTLEGAETYDAPVVQSGGAPPMPNINESADNTFYLNYTKYHGAPDEQKGEMPTVESPITGTGKQVTSLPLPQSLLPSTFVNVDIAEKSPKIPKTAKTLKAAENRAKTSTKTRNILPKSPYGAILSRISNGHQTSRLPWIQDSVRSQQSGHQVTKNNSIVSHRPVKQKYTSTLSSNRSMPIHRPKVPAPLSKKRSKKPVRETNEA